MKRFIDKIVNHGGGGTLLSFANLISKGCRNVKIGYNGDEVLHDYNGDCMKKRFAFTLAELVIVMLVIAVVAGVSIKITKAKLDSVISYTYYSAYNTLRSVAGEMMADSDDAEEYGDLSYNKNKSLVDKFIDKYLVPPVAAAISSNTVLAPGDIGDTQINDIQCMAGYIKKCVSGMHNDGGCYCEKVPNVSLCPEGETRFCDTDGNCRCLPQLHICVNWEDEPICTAAGGTWSNFTCSCSAKVACSGQEAERNMCITEGGVWNDTTCQCSLSSAECSAADALSCTTNGGTWNNTTCACTGQCTLTQADCSRKQVLDRDNCRCRDKLVTLPKTGEEFCKSFVNHTNTISSNCSGKNSAAVSTAVNAGNFKDLAPDIVLRNGMKVYNAKNDYVKITALEGNSPIVYNLETNPLFIDSVFTAHSIIREKFAYLVHNLFEQPAFARCAQMHSTDGSCPGQYCDSKIHKEGTGCFACCTPKNNNLTCGGDYILVNGMCVCDKTCSSGYTVDPDTCTCKKDTSPPSSEGSCSQTAKESCQASNGTWNVVNSTTCTCTPKDDGNPPGGETPDEPNEEGLPSNLNEHGYIVYIDVDGEKGESILYEDVFPFYVTLEGRVIPAYQTGVEAGGNSTSHLTVSVQYDTYAGGDRRENWMTPKGTDFQHAACMSGFVTANTYCTGVNDAQIATKRALCSQTSSDCRVKVNKPLRF